MLTKLFTHHIRPHGRHDGRTIRILLTAVLLLQLPLPALAALSDPWTMWEFMRNYTGADKIDRLHNSFAVGTRGCSGTMISPHIYLSAAHCGGPLITVRFYHIDEDAPGPAAQYQQQSQPYRGRPLPWQSFIHPTGTQEGDTQLFWLEDGSDGVPPGIKYGYIELSVPASVVGEQLYSFWFNPQDGLVDTVLYSDGVVTTVGTQPIGDPPLYFAKSNLYTQGGASGSSVLRSSDQRIMGVTAIGGGNSRTTADMAHLLSGYDGEVDQVLDAVEYDLMLTSTRLNFQHLRFNTPLQRAQWRPVDISGSLGHGPNLNAGLVGGSMIGPAAYRAHWNSPWMPQDRSQWVPTLQLETFEDGQLNLPGVSASAGSVLGPSPNTDSADQDDGNLDNFSGTGGHSFFSANGSAGITFTFNPAVLGSLPTRAGIVWTDGDGATTFEAYDGTGALIRRIGPIVINDGALNGGTREDRLFAIAHQGGIGSIKISNSQGGIEVDHLHVGTSPLFYTDPAPPRDALWHANARFAPNASYRISVAVYGLTSGNRQGYLKLRSNKGNVESTFPFTPVQGGWQRISGRVTLGNYDDYRLLVGGDGQGSFYLSEVTLLREDGNAALTFDTGEERRAWEYVGGSHPTSWGVNGAGDFAAVVVGPSATDPNNPSDYGWNLRNRHIGLEANKVYEISFDALHSAGPFDRELFANIEDLSGIVDGQFHWRFASAGERTTKTFQVTTHHGRNGITFGAYGATTYLVDNIRIREIGSAQACTPSITATGNQPGEAGSTHAFAHDGTLSTFFNSSYIDWQYIQLDFSCIAEIAAFRRYMTRNGTSTAGNRGSQGEGFAYSLDGVHWVNVTAVSSTGWQNYVNLRPHAWSSLNYGWSAWLQLNTPVYARYVRFNWDDNGDAVNEIQTRLAGGVTASLPDAALEAKPEEETASMR
jgi:hypothetical protein